MPLFAGGLFSGGLVEEFPRSEDQCPTDAAVVKAPEIPGVAGKEEVHPMGHRRRMNHPVIFG